MEKLEEVGRERGWTLLVSLIRSLESFGGSSDVSQMLDIEIGSPAELVYPRLGYTRMGVVPRYGISPKDGRLVDEVWFYKDLREGT